MTDNTQTLNAKGEPEGHEQRMIDKANGVTREEPTPDPERPDWLPEKFSTVEEMAEAYKQLESKLGAGGDKGSTEGGEGDTEGANTDDQKAAEKAVEDAGLDMDALTQEFQTDGELSEASLAKLEKAGISKDMVDAYVAGQMALAEQATQRVYARVGGEETFKEMVSWAADNMTPEEIKAYNAAVDSGDEGQINLALDGLSAKFKASRGTKPNLIGGRKSSTGTDTFQSTSELTSAMRDPRYKTDPAYRRAVEEKLARSDKF